MREVILTILLAICLTPAGAQTRRGKASYYSKRATGARAASGVRIHHDSLTCAHRTYPFGTLLKVKNLSNGREVVVKVIDRGPFSRNRIIDLSYGAAKELGMLSDGIAMVEVKRLDSPPYRMDEETGLPDFDFDFKDVAYSFIEKWDLPDEPEQNLVNKKMPTKEQAQKKRQAIRKKASRTHIKINRNEAMKTQLKPHNGQQKKKEKEGEASSWRNVFDKIKNWLE
ncbi:MAG: septal ring lytic transglycosylase RlpA family protein [Prevotella sp.]